MKVMEKKLDVEINVLPRPEHALETTSKIEALKECNAHCQQWSCIMDNVGTKFKPKTLTFLSSDCSHGRTAWLGVNS